MTGEHIRTTRDPILSDGSSNSTSPESSHRSIPTKNKTQDRKPKMATVFDDKTITVEVGASKHRFNVSKHLLVTKSKFFARCLSSLFREGGSSHVLLEEEDIQTFEMFTNWLYKGRLDTYTLAQYKTSPDPWTEHLALVVFAEKFIVPALHNEIIDLVLRLPLSVTMPVSAAQWAWDRLPPNSRLRKLFIAYFVNVETIDQHFASAAAVTSTDFLLTIAKTLSENYSNGKRVKLETTAGGRCREYHRHEQGEANCGSKANDVVLGEQSGMPSDIIPRSRR